MLIAEFQILLDACCEQHWLLAHIADLVSEPGKIELAEVVAIEEDPALIGVVKSHD